MKDFAKDIVAKIKNEHVLPESRFRLHFRSYAFWFLMACMVVFGALSLSLVVFNVSDIDPRFLKNVELRKLIFILFVTAPYLWMLLSFLALVSGVMAFRNTARGYRQSTLFVTSLVVLTVSILGVVGHVLNIDHRVDGMISKNAPQHIRVFASPKEGRWIRPGDGLIGGEITNIADRGFSLRSFDDHAWSISYDDDVEREDLDDIVIGGKVGVIGEKTGEFSMRARSMRSFPDDWNGDPLRGSLPFDEDDRHSDGEREFPSLPSGEDRTDE